MPIYEYQCDRCGEIEEALQKISDAPLAQCKKCSGRLHKLISHSAFHLKGTGWYVTDYADKGAPKEFKANEDVAAKSTGSCESSAPAPPAPAKAKSDQ